MWSLDRPPTFRKHTIIYSFPVCESKSAGRVILLAFPRGEQCLVTSLGFLRTQNGIVTIPMETTSSHDSACKVANDDVSERTKSVPSDKDSQPNATKVLPMAAFQVQPTEESSTAGHTQDRGKWEGRLDFIFGCINYAIGLGNVWRFPYLCYENGGGAFLVPYFVCLVLTAIPSFLLEVALGQYVCRGGIGVWKLVPIFKGVGIASMVMVFFSNVYYIILVAWIMFYLFASFTSELPWQHCGNYWNTERCRELNGTSLVNSTFTTPVQEYWEQRVLNISTGLEDVGGVRSELALCLLLAWTIVFLVTWRGIHQSGKIIWCTALFPYVILLVLLVRGVTLPGASVGLLFYVTPQWEKLLDPHVWIAAGTQVFYTFGIGFGSVIALGSYNKFNHNFFRDSMVLCVVNPMTSIVAGVVIFSVLGHLAHVTGREVGDVFRSGPGLAFVAYPEVVAKMPAAPVWSVLFFLMLLVVGIDSQFCTAEALIAGLIDVWPVLLRSRKHVTFAFCTIQFLLGLSMVTKGGIYLFQLVDSYAVSGMTLLFIVFFQNVAISWFYGSNRFASNIKEMIGYSPNWFFRAGWMVFVPFFCITIFLSSVIQYRPPVYAKTYFYPWWGELIGWFMALISVMMIPIYAIYYLITAKGSLFKLFQIVCQVEHGFRCEKGDYSRH
ncbi:sodium- and chloride-dependent GABA transporter 1-like isoform X2 [Dermacentor variabilis]|uniref:sodium- and chloride-dependent GABA transporter 1-like isoform X2 n=1 Tax=Dermacentor variabilis TaxID=34621 RepID=UPI003F5C8DE6